MLCCRSLQDEGHRGAFNQMMHMQFQGVGQACASFCAAWL